MILIYSQEAKERLKHLHPEIRKGLRRVLEDLRENPYLGKSLRRELEGFWSARWKRYRIIYRWTNQKILEVYTIGQRERVYEDLSLSLKQSRQTR